MNWDFTLGLGTSLDSEGRLDPSIYNPEIYSSAALQKVHKLFSIEAVSQPRSGSERRGEIILDIRGCFVGGSNKPPCSEAVVRLIEEAIQKPVSRMVSIQRCGARIALPETKSWSDTKFTLSFSLEDGDQFCAAAIELSRAVFEGLGIKDDNSYHLAQFSLKRETFVRLDDAWITFPRWLRMNHRLQIYGPEDRV